MVCITLSCGMNLKGAHHHPTHTGLLAEDIGMSLLQVSPNDYLETALMPVGGVGPAVEAKNAIRTSIKSLFPERDCATLVRPMHDEQVGLVGLQASSAGCINPSLPSLSAVTNQNLSFVCWLLQ